MDQDGDTDQFERQRDCHDRLEHRAQHTRTSGPRVASPGRGSRDAVAAGHRSPRGRPAAVGRKYYRNWPEMQCRTTCSINPGPALLKQRFQPHSRSSQPVFESRPRFRQL